MRNIPDDNLAYPVLINLSTGSSGSGFLLHTDTTLYLVTAKHVLYNNTVLRATSAAIVCQTKNVDDDSVYMINVDLAILNNAGQLFQHATRDVAAFTIGTIATNEAGMFCNMSTE